ncbi:SPFH domain-containing protein [Chromobacterium paludis]|uniref:Protease modulator HflK n=1 Tax=Chromobacterium paludis TaxID=2605945 RepID=A0A5C1DF50_9NEIS|nr:SPFH domain-containing protein [Chromobacterium paludis]QEL54527.1 protease modulator HflK [Chromobacterium paludis]
MKPSPADAPLAQSLRLAYLLLMAAAALSGLAWLLAHVRSIPADSQAVVWRFGAIDRVRHAGLLLAWPSPLEEVTMLPSPETVLQRRVALLARDGDAAQLDDEDMPLAQMGDRLAGSGYLLTGDLAVVQLSATVYYRIVDPSAYVLQGGQALPLLDRVVAASALKLCAGRGLESILATREARLSSANAAERERLRAELAQASNQALDALQSRGAGLGLQVARIDLQSALPRSAQAAFDDVLTADQTVQRQLAQASTAAALGKQQARAAVDSQLANARAQAGERLSLARAETSEIAALAPGMRAPAGAERLRQLYLERMQAVLAKAGKVTTVDPAGSGRLILPGEKP